jgi:5-methylcytosine-specific restriction endonuclease McrA
MRADDIIRLGFRMLTGRSVPGARQRPQRPVGNPHGLSSEFIASPQFLRTDEWIRLRYDVMKWSKGQCQLCGRSRADGIKLNADHIKPRKTHPHLALTYGNIQVLCAECNKGKGNRHADDWR